MEKSDNPFFIDLARIVILIFLVIIGWLFGKLFLLLMNGLCGGLDDTKPDVERNCTIIWTYLCNQWINIIQTQTQS